MKAFCKAAIVQKPGAELLAGVLYARYVEYCHVRGEKPVSNTAFGRRLSELGYARSKRGGIARYQGVAMREPTPAAIVTKAEPRLKIVKA